MNHSIPALLDATAAASLRREEAPVRSRSQRGDASEHVVFVDAEGTLLSVSLTAESFLRALKRNLAIVILAFFWRVRGLPYFKHKLAEFSSIDGRYLPYNEAALLRVRRTHDAGARLVLVTSSNYAIGWAISDALGLFHTVIASDAENDIPTQKAETISAYCWSRGISSYEVLDKNSFAPPISPSSMEISRRILRALRPHHWVKNLLVFIPLLTSHQLHDVEKLVSASFAFLAFSAAASAVYLMNDVFDIDADRRHATKCRRPLAAGILTIELYLFLTVALIAASIALSIGLPADFLKCLGGYYLANIAYSWLLKKMVVADVMALAGLYLLRMFAGGVATEIEISSWLFGFALFVCTSVALAKRYSELMAFKAQNLLEEIPGRAYQAQDSQIVGGIGIACGLTAVVVLALYIESDQVSLLYEDSRTLWIVCVLFLYWISRLWVLAGRGNAEDPVIFATTDAPGVMAIMASVFVIYWQSL